MDTILRSLHTFRYLHYLAFVVFLFGSCAVPQNNVNTSPSAYAWKNGIKGQWKLEIINRDEIPADHTVKILFEEAPPECFLGSIWTLPLNGNGSITFSASGRLCAPGAVRNIYWSIHNPRKGEGEPQFQFKKIYPGDHHKHVLAGYRLELAYADERNMRMIMPVPLSNGKTGRLIFNFVNVL